MKKLMYLAMLAACCSLMFNSCKSKDKDPNEDDMDSLTLTIAVSDLA